MLANHAQDPLAGGDTAYPGGGFPTEPPQSGALVAIGILNIIFALICGCTGGVVTMMAAGVTGASGEDRDAFRDVMAQQWEQAKQQQISGAPTEEQRQQTERLFEALDDAGMVDALTDAVISLGQSDSARTLVSVGLLSLILKVFLLVASALLLARVRVSRLLCLIALGGILATTLYEGVLQNEVAGALGDHMVPVMQRMLEEAPGAARDPQVEDEIQQMPHLFTKGVAIGSIVLTTVNGVYPLIAFLIILLSAGIKMALGLTPPEGMASSY